jgi:adenylate cyclase
MTTAPNTPAAASRVSIVSGMLPYEREVRLGAGLVLFTFVLTHFLNHALGIFGIEWMEWAQTWRSGFWRTRIGTVALYGAFLVHVLLALKRIVARRTWRMPWMEAAQIALGLMIPALALDHVVATRHLSTYYGFDDTYRYELRLLWPSVALKQMLLLLVVWFHGVIGINYVFRSRTWFPRVREVGLVIAFVVPLLALAGFVSAGRESLELDLPGAGWTPEQVDAFNRTTLVVNKVLMGVAAALIAIILGRVVYRRFTKRIRIRYTGHGEVFAAPGQTLLEISRANGIPHPSQCGGRARCSTCRVLVLSGQDRLPEPSQVERNVLKRISAPARVRLACQLRPAGDVAVQILLPLTGRASAAGWEEEAFKWGVERDVTILFVDVRGFTSLARKQLPSDLVVVLNRVISEMSQTVEARGGRVAMYLSDGLMAVFGLNSSRGAGSRAAIHAALDMLKVARALNTEFASALSMPLRIGVGIHTGPAVIARIGDEERGYTVTALGETVSIASRLEAATKELLADCLISEEAISASGLKLLGTSQKEIHARERSTPVKAHAIADLAEVESETA